MAITTPESESAFAMAKAVFGSVGERLKMVSSSHAPPSRPAQVTPSQRQLFTATVASAPLPHIPPVEGATVATTDGHAPLVVELGRDLLELGDRVGGVPAGQGGPQTKDVGMPPAESRSITLQNMTTVGLTSEEADFFESKIRPLLATFGPAQRSIPVRNQIRARSRYTSRLSPS